MTILEAQLRVGAESAEEVFDFLSDATSALETALTRHFFAPAVLARPIATRRVTSVGDDPVTVVMEMAIDHYNHTRGILGVFKGMCEWQRGRRHLRIEWVRARQDGVDFACDSSELPERQRAQSLPFQVLLPPLFFPVDHWTAHFHFHTPPDDARIAWFEQALHAWETLLQGGLPLDPRRLGESGTGASSGQLIAPRTYQWHIEGVAARATCLDLLLSFLSNQGDVLGLSRFELEI